MGSVDTKNIAGGVMGANSINNTGAPQKDPEARALQDQIDKLAHAYGNNEALPSAEPPDMLTESDIALGGINASTGANGVAIGTSAEGTNKVNNKNLGAGVSVASGGASSIYLKSGSTSFGLTVNPLLEAISSGDPSKLFKTSFWAGIGNINVSSSGDFAFGLISKSAPNPIFMMLWGGVLLIRTGTEMEEGSSFGEFALTLSSRVLIEATPINTARELLQYLIHTEEKACNGITDQLGLMRAQMYIKSYAWQGLYNVGHDMIEGGIEELMDADYCDPAMLAMFKAEHDNIRAAQRANGIWIGAADDIQNNIETTISDTNKFMTEHADWLNGTKTGELSTEDKNAIRVFLANSTYLLQKLKLTVTIEDNEVIVTSSAPLVFDTDKDVKSLTALITTVANAYNALAKKPVWDFIASELNGLSTDLTTNAGSFTSNELLSKWFRYKNILSITEEITSSNVPKFFDRRKTHLLLRMLDERDLKSKTTDEDLKLMWSTRIDNNTAIEGMRASCYAAAVLDKKMNVMAELGDVYDAMEKLERLGYVYDPLSETVGLDLRHLNDGLDVVNAFDALARLEEFSSKFGAEYPELVAALRTKIDEMFAVVQEVHSGELADLAAERAHGEDSRASEMVTDVNWRLDVMHDELAEVEPKIFDTPEYIDLMQAADTLKIGGMTQSEAKEEAKDFVGDSEEGVGLIANLRGFIGSARDVKARGIMEKISAEMTADINAEIKKICEQWLKLLNEQNGMPLEAKQDSVETIIKEMDVLAKMLKDTFDVEGEKIGFLGRAITFLAEIREQLGAGKVLDKGDNENFIRLVFEPMNIVREICSKEAIDEKTRDAMKGIDEKYKRALDALDDAKERYLQLSRYRVDSYVMPVHLDAGDLE